MTDAVKTNNRRKPSLISHKRNKCAWMTTEMCWLFREIPLNLHFYFRTEVVNTERRTRSKKGMKINFCFLAFGFIAALNAKAYEEWTHNLDYDVVSDWLGFKFMTLPCQHVR